MRSCAASSAMNWRMIRIAAARETLGPAYRSSQIHLSYEPLPPEPAVTRALLAFPQMVLIFPVTLV